MSIIGKTIASVDDSGGVTIVFEDGSGYRISAYDIETQELSPQDFADEQRADQIMTRLWAESNSVSDLVSRDEWKSAVYDCSKSRYVSDPRETYGDPIGWGGFWRVKGTAATSTPQSDIDWIREYRERDATGC